MSVPDAPEPDSEAGAETCSGEVPVGRRQVRRPGHARPHVHKVKVTAEQELRLAAAAGERGITVSRLLVESALAGGADAAAWKSEMWGELFRNTRLLGKVGVNINQIARATNATLETQPETVAAMAAVARVTARMEQLLDDLENGSSSRSGRGAGVEAS